MNPSVLAAGIHDWASFISGWAPDILRMAFEPLIHRISEYAPFEKVVFGNYLLRVSSFLEAELVSMFLQLQDVKWLRPNGRWSIK